MEPIQVIKWKCPICDCEDEDQSSIIDHIKTWKISESPIIVNGTIVPIKNKYPANTFSVARLKDWYFNSYHFRYYYLDRLLLFKDADNFPEGLEGEVVSEFEILSLDELKEYRFEQARCSKIDDLKDLVKELHIKD